MIAAQPSGPEMTGFVFGFIGLTILLAAIAVYFNNDDPDIP